MKNTDLVKQSNYITHARYNFSEYEMSVLIHIIKDIQNKLNSNLPEFNKTLFGDIQHKVHFNLTDISADNPSRVKRALKDLRQKSFEVEDEHMWFECGFIDSARYEKAIKQYEVRISPLLMPYMISTARGYTQYQLNATLRMNNYSKRLYMLFSRFTESGIFRINADKLRDNLGIRNSYKEYKDFKKRVLNSALKEINDLFEKGKCDLKTDFKNDKRKKMEGDWDRLLEFTIISSKAKRSIDHTTKDEYYRYIVNVLKSVFKDRPEIGNKIANYMSVNKKMALFRPRLERLEEQAEQENKPLSAYAGLVTTIVKDDYGYKH